MVRKTMMMYRIAIMVLLAAAILIGCGGNTEEGAPVEKQVVRVSVKTEPVVMRDFPVIERIGGTLRGERQTTIPARVTTTVTKIPSSIGQNVSKGDLLVMLDRGGVQSQYQQAEAVFRNAEKQWKKMSALYKAGAISEMQMDGAETEYEVAKANFNSARQSIEIEAPFDGVVTDIHVRLGDEVAPGMPIVEIADIDALRLLLEVPASQVTKLKNGQKVLVPLPSDNSIVMKGKVSSIADAADRATRSFEVECHFATPLSGFAPGMYVTADIETEILSSALVVPSDALLYRSGKAMLYAVDSDTAALITINELASGMGLSAIEGGISEGQKVVTIGHKNLTPGTTVREAGQ